MSDAVLIAIITASGGALTAILLFIRRLLPPRRASSRDADIESVWTEVRQLRTDLNSVVDERDEYRTTARVLADAYDALTAAVERSNPPVVLTAAERGAIERAKRRRLEDDSTWPTQQSPPVTT